MTWWRVIRNLGRDETLALRKSLLRASPVRPLSFAVRAPLKPRVAFLATRVTHALRPWQTLLVACDERCFVRSGKQATDSLTVRASIFTVRDGVFTSQKERRGPEGRGSLLVFRAAVNPSLEAAAKTSLFLTPRKTSKAIHL
jgi:hypothetical protein